ncbi:hypothetical protein EW146_g8876 [Bondarzewia mesenterica]|uniref:Uncharacterized protein n=1 Tax=Bondarzewia mesenterica TaxID=1095465 RepID=A0A4S4LB12_9AGAM|nr:hypothetical protein EW146_g8876 [Bondarzewia mesenterica]
MDDSTAFFLIFREVQAEISYTNSLIQRTIVSCVRSAKEASNSFFAADTVLIWRNVWRLFNFQETVSASRVSRRSDPQVDTIGAFLYLTMQHDDSHSTAERKFRLVTGPDDVVGFQGTSDDDKSASELQPVSLSKTPTPPACRWAPLRFNPEPGTLCIALGGFYGSEGTITITVGGNNADRAIARFGCPNVQDNYAYWNIKAPKGKYAWDVSGFSKTGVLIVDFIVGPRPGPRQTSDGSPCTSLLVIAFCSHVAHNVSHLAVSEDLKNDTTSEQSVDNKSDQDVV